MKVCIVGAGAVGGFIGTRLAVGGHCAVTALARGATLAALREHGWRLRQGGALLQAGAMASDDARTLGVQDLVVITVKGPAMATVAPAIAPLLGAHTVVLPAMNGVPWWFSQGIGALADAPLASVDPGGRIAAAIPYAQVLGGVVHLAVATAEPGLVEHRMGDRLIVGEPGGGVSGRALQVAALLSQAGLQATASDAIRQEVWYKLWGNLTINPVSAITGATSDLLLGDELVRKFCSAVMVEASAVGERIGCSVAQTPEERHAVTLKLGAFRSSMLQDVQAGRPIELDAIVGAVHEIGRRIGLPTPNIDALLGLTRLFARVRGLLPAA
jgi:2-dehydropantoate 2-reductase